MKAPFYELGAFGDEMSLVVALVIGIAFGFFLERAGFGSSRKLVSQFYLDDLSVFKVMFTAIVTAMLGAHGLAAIGVLDLSLVYQTPTNLWPQVVGGIVLIRLRHRRLAGHLGGGATPGYRRDGYVLARPGNVRDGRFRTYRPSTKAAPWELTSPGLHLPVPVVLLLVTLMAAGGFAGAEWLERRAREEESR
jgi:hypothetical protein